MTPKNADPYRSIGLARVGLIVKHELAAFTGDGSLGQAAAPHIWRVASSCVGPRLPSPARGF